MRSWMLPTRALLGLALLSFSCSFVTPPGPGPELRAEQRALAERAAGVAAFFDARETGLQPSEIDAVATTLVTAAAAADIELAVVLGVIDVESSGNTFAVSDAGAMGLMQLRPATAAAVAERIGVRWRGASTLFDPVANVRLGVAYLAELRERYGRMDVALAAYNWGPTHIAHRLESGRALPVDYPRRVFEATARVRGEESGPAI